MKQEIEVLRTIRRASRSIKGWRALVALGVLALGLATAAVSVTHVSAGGNDGATKWPAYYKDAVYSIMMGPGDNSKSDKQIRALCWGLGPDISHAAAPKGLLPFYAIFYDAPDHENQMGCEVEGFWHDMVLSAIPGDPGYSPKVQVFGCVPGTGFSPPYMDADVVKAEADKVDGQIVCAAGNILFAQVVEGPGVAP